MDPTKGFERLREAVSARVVFDGPVEQGDTTLVPAATVIGGGGLGANEASQEGDRPAGAGGGYGIVAWPTGAFEIRGDSVRWHPAGDRTRIALSVIFFAYLLLKAISASR